MRVDLSVRERTYYNNDNNEKIQCEVKFNNEQIIVMIQMKKKRIAM